MLRLAGILGLLLASSALADGTTLLGVLEEPQCAKGASVRGRIMFVSNGSRWESLASRDSKPSLEVTAASWTIALEGKVVGALALEDPTTGSPQATDWFYARDRLFSPIGKYPLVKNYGAFGGWCEAPSQRPLVLSSRSAVADPAEWKPLPTKKVDRKDLYVPMKLVLGRTNVFRCGDANHARPEPFEFHAEDLKLYKAYRSKAGSTLVSIGLDPTKNRCDGPPEPAWWSQWFLLHDDEIDFIGHGMELVDVGDYDGDGKSELLFWRTAYKRDGYVLVFDDMRQKVEYTWTYE